MKLSTRDTLLTALLLAAADAQTTTIVNDAQDTGATTITYSVCPTALTTTTTLSSTMTVTCDNNGQCTGPPAITGGPILGAQTSEILAYTTTLPNGEVMELHEYMTVYPQICSGGSSIGAATYTITEECPCMETPNPTAIPSGFTTTVTACDVCHNGGPTTLTQTVPCTTGPYASVTPQIGPTANAPWAQAAASAGANAQAAAGAGGSGSSGNSGSSGSGSPGSGSAGSGSPGSGSPGSANAAANANAGANANAQAGSPGNNGAAGANSASEGNSAANANSGGSNAAASAGANAAASAGAAVGANSGSVWNNGTTPNNNTISPPITPVNPGAASGASGASSSQYTGSADRLGFAVSSVLAVVWLKGNKIPVISDEFILKASTARQAGSDLDVFNTGNATLDQQVERRDYDIPTRDGVTRSRIYRLKPEHRSTEDGAPLVVMFHPGGFCLGEYTTMDVEAHTLCKRFGATCVSINYRLAPEHQFPAAAHDAWDSLKWIAANATGPILGSDPSKGFIVSGVSAGGTSAGVVSHLARDEEMKPPLTGVHLSIPGLMQQEAIPEKLKHEFLSFEQNKDAPTLNLEAVELLARTYNGDVYSPLHNVLFNPNGHGKLPPHYLQVCGLDPLRDNALVYERMLRKEHGIATKIDVYPGQPHAFWFIAPQLKASTKYHEDVLAGFEWLLNGSDGRRGVKL
ncbi:hypothetical protein H2200_009292 [Cladophialophora chaetospira]|uniref:Alpha/beta hydrolase fold-3 domain-containing protein n=1 Tax=Cladophialophora chaetospira TaxID=386627 RepID=A0AA38X410_9EURO|nr:hypothetical protein H2200_009292 [Cladophialophora chaetospira]